MPFTKKANKIYQSKEKFNQKQSKINYVDSLPVKPEMVSIKISDIASLVDDLNSSANTKELNFIKNAKGVRRVIGDHMEEIDDIELVLVGPNLYHGWEMNTCKSKKIHEITIQFHNDLFDEALLSRRIM